MHRNRPVVLLTGFGPFPTIPANATTVLVPQIAAAAEQVFKGIAFPVEVLPTEWHAGIARAEHLYHRHRPILALHFGVSGRAHGFEIETRARNHCSKSRDAAGLLPALTCLSPRGPEFLASALPAAHIVDRLRRRGLPASISRDAGGYLCNALLYRALEFCRGASEAPRSGFIHLPASLVNEHQPWRGPLPSCRLDWQDVVTGGLEIIAACLGKPAPRIELQSRLMRPAIRPAPTGSSR